jgi:hypothetical protein
MEELSSFREMLALVCSGRDCKYIDRLRGVAIVDESSDATAISSAHLFEDGPVSTALLERHEGPLVLTTN